MSTRQGEAMATVGTVRETPQLEIYGPGDGGSLIDIRSRRHMMRNPADPRITPWPALVGWVNLDRDYNGTLVCEAMYAGPYRPAASQVKTFGDPLEAIRWIAGLFGEEY
jgi:hypothetical protein